MNLCLRMYAVSSGIDLTENKDYNTLVKLFALDPACLCGSSNIKMNHNFNHIVRKERKTLTNLEKKPPSLLENNNVAICCQC